MEGSIHHPAQGAKSLVGITSLQEMWQTGKPQISSHSRSHCTFQEKLFSLLGLSVQDAEVNKFQRQNCSRLCKRSWRLLTPVNSRDNSRGVQALVCFKYNLQKC